MLIIGYGKVCNSKLTLSNFAEISNYTAALNIPLRIQYLRIVILFTGSLFSRGISERKREKRLRALRASSHSVQVFFDRRKI